MKTDVKPEMVETRRKYQAKSSNSEKATIDVQDIANKDEAKPEIVETRRKYQAKSSNHEKAGQTRTG
jgi:hypothetical protein